MYLGGFLEDDLRTILALLGTMLVGCGGASGSDELVASLMSAADGMAVETESHVRQVDGARDVGDVTAMIDAHDTRMEQLRARMAAAMGQMGSCGMNGAASSALDVDRREMDMIETDLGAYRTAHEQHTSVEECRQAAAEHARQVGEEVGRIRDQRQPMMAGMHCDGMAAMHSYGTR